MPYAELERLKNDVKQLKAQHKDELAQQAQRVRMEAVHASASHIDELERRYTLLGYTTRIQY